MEPVLLAFGQPANLSRNVEALLRVLVIGAPGYIGFESLKKYLQMSEGSRILIGIMRASTIVLLFVFPLNVALNVWLIHGTSLGLLGSPCTFHHLLAHLENGAWAGFQVKTVLDFRSCYSFLRLAIPGILMVGTGWSAFEIVALAAVRLGELPLAAQSVIMTTDQILNTIPFGIGVAATTRVGHLIGSRSASGTKRAAHASAILSVIVGAFVMVLMLWSKDVYGFLFSDDVDVVNLVAAVMPLVASFQIVDGLANSCDGVLRGQGRQQLGAVFNFVAYYVIALPMGITLAFQADTQLGLQGLWIGRSLTTRPVVVLKTDWAREVEKGVERNAEKADRHALLHASAQL
ncbi:mate-domain-containing protein [Lyophyllum atratum]|nr:mate-domain-containing protein [Lyophyllum atratum]